MAQRGDEGTNKQMDGGTNEQTDRKSPHSTRLYPVLGPLTENDGAESGVKEVAFI